MASSRPPITILLGAGFSAGLHLPTTAELTAIVRGEGRRPYNPLIMAPRELTTSEIMWRMASGYYAQPNFETMLHLAETALAYRQVRGWLQENDRAKPAYGAFMNVMPHWRELIDRGVNWDFLRFIEGALATIAAHLVTKADQLEQPSLGYARTFFDHLDSEYSLVIANLNYDDIVERSIPTWHDGFEADQQRLRFKSRSLLEQRDEPTLLHLHGSVRWYRAVAADELARPLELFRAHDGHFPEQPGRRKIDGLFAAGDYIAVGPLISGLRKTDKIAVEPFSTYHWKVRDALLRSSRVVIVGYGGWDSYLSNLLEDFSNVHGQDTRFAVIAHRPPEALWIDNSLLVAAPLLEIRSVIDWGPVLDEAFANRAWSGNKYAKVFTNGFPLEADDIAGLMYFLRD